MAMRWGGHHHLSKAFVLGFSLVGCAVIFRVKAAIESCVCERLALLNSFCAQHWRGSFVVKFFLRVCVSLKRAVIFCPASTHTALGGETDFVVALVSRRVRFLYGYSIVFDVVEQCTRRRRTQVENGRSSSPRAIQKTCHVSTAVQSVSE